MVEQFCHLFFPRNPFRESMDAGLLYSRKPLEANKNKAFGRDPRVAAGVELPWSVTSPPWSNLWLSDASGANLLSSVCPDCALRILHISLCCSTPSVALSVRIGLSLFFPWHGSIEGATGIGDGTKLKLRKSREHAWRLHTSRRML